MATYEVDVKGTTYEVDAPDERTAWAWANQTHSQQKPEPKQTEITPEMRKQAYREAAQGMPWLQRNLAAMATPVVGGVEAVKSWFGKGDVEEQQRIAALQEEAPVGHIAGMLSTSVLPGMGAPAAATALGRIGTAAGLGAVGGMLTPTGKQKAEISDVAGQAAIGGLTGAAAGGAIEGFMAAGRGARNLFGPLTKAGAEKAAGRLASQIAGKNSDEIIRMLRTGEIDETAVQAAVKSGKAEFAALGDIVSKARMPSEYGAIESAQEVARKARIEGVTPDLPASISARQAAADPFYEKAKKAVVTIDPKMANLFERMPSGTMEAAANIARMENRPFQIGKYSAAQEAPIGVLDESGKMITRNLPAEYPKITGESLHYIKRALSDISNATDPSKGIGRDAQKAAREVLDDFLGAFEKRVPAYGTARKIFKEESIPINQAQVLQEMRSVLEKPTGGERVTPFLNVLGRGEQAMLKRSTGYPRFEQGDISKILSPDQLSAVQKTSGEMLRDAEVERLAGLGMEKTRKAIGAFEKPVPITGLLDRAVTLFNSAIRRMEGAGGEKIETSLAELMLPQNKAKLADLMEKAKPSERAALAKARAMYINGMALGQAAGQGVSQ